MPCAQTNDLLAFARENMTRREAEVLLWTAEGKTAWEIGVILGVSEGTVRAHLAHILDKLSAANKPHAVARGFVAGIIVKRAAVVAAVAVIMLSHPSEDMTRIRRPMTYRQLVRQAASLARGNGRA